MTDTWDTKLVVSVGGKPAAVVQQFTSTITTTNTPLHSITADNVGNVMGTTTYGFSITLGANSSALADLTVMAVNRASFTLVVSEQTGASWAFKSLTFHDCFVTSIQPSTVVPGALPSAVVAGIALSAEAEVPTP